MAEFISIVKKAACGALYVDIPKEIMKSMKLKQFMAGRMRAEKAGIKIFGFEKTVKIKIDIDEKTLAIAKKIMLLEGYGSLDETISNVIHEVFEKEKKDKTKIVYLYPEEYLKSKFLLIADFEKNICEKEEKNAKKFS
jgi:hypothetical protein